MVYAVDEALRIIDGYEPPDPRVSTVPAAPGRVTASARRRAACSTTATRLTRRAPIRDAGIVPPTSQNQAAIEADLRGVVERHLDLDDAELTTLCEQAIRNYDPCISCATHFLDLRVERR